jgi:hypothetical protein
MDEGSDAELACSLPLDTETDGYEVVVSVSHGSEDGGGGGGVLDVVSQGSSDGDDVDFGVTVEAT